MCVCVCVRERERTEHRAHWSTGLHFFFDSKQASKHSANKNRSNGRQRMETDRRNFAVRTYRVSKDSSSSDDPLSSAMHDDDYNYSGDDPEGELVDVNLSHEEASLYYDSGSRGGGGSKVENNKKQKKKDLLQHHASSSRSALSSKYVTARSSSQSTNNHTTRPKAQVPRVPNKAGATTLALTEANQNAGGHSSSSSSSHLNKKEKLVDLLLKVARKETAREDFNLSRRTKRLVEQMLDQDRPLLFYAHLIELVQTLSAASDDDPSLPSKQMLVVLDSLSASLLSKSEERQARKKPSYTFNLFGGGEAKNSNRSEGGGGGHLRFEGRKIRALLALESLTHNCPENFARYVG